MQKSDQDVIVRILHRSRWHIRTLEAVRELRLPDWAIGAGFVRNAVWDHLHGYDEITPLADVDVLYFDRHNPEPAREFEIERMLHAKLPGRPWSVRNQARMHMRNGDSPYRSTEDALLFWLETATCVAVRLGDNGDIIVMAPHGLADLLDMRSAPTPRGREKLQQYKERMKQKDWPSRWPKVIVREW